MELSCKSKCTYVKFSITILGNNRTKKQKLRGHFALLAVIWHRTLSRNRGDFSNLQCAPKMENKCKNNKMCSTFEVLQWLKLKFVLNFSSLYFLVQISEPPLLWSKSFEKKNVFFLRIFRALCKCWQLQLKNQDPVVWWKQFALTSNTVLLFQSCIAH